MAGVRVTMQRCDAFGISPAERLFEDADDWGFGYERNISTLHIIKYDKPDADDGFGRKTIAEFPALGIESVEFA